MRSEAFSNAWAKRGACAGRSVREHWIAPARADRIMARLAMLALAAFVLALLFHGLPR